MIPTSIILHHSLTKDTQTVSWGAIRKYHTEDCGWDDIGYHFGIEQVGNDYEIFVGRMMTVPGAHCKGHNANSLGICFVGNFDAAAPPKKQWRLGVELVGSLIDIFNISKYNIFTHNELAPWKSCPGIMFDIEKFKKDLG
jgi:hypothetical protein